MSQHGRITPRLWPVPGALRSARPPIIRLLPKTESGPAWRTERRRPFSPRQLPDRGGRRPNAAPGDPFSPSSPLLASDPASRAPAWRPLLQSKYRARARCLSVPLSQRRPPPPSRQRHRPRFSCMIRPRWPGSLHQLACGQAYKLNVSYYLMYLNPGSRHSRQWGGQKPLNPTAGPGGRLGGRISRGSSPVKRATVALPAQCVSPNQARPEMTSSSQRQAQNFQWIRKDVKDGERSSVRASVAEVALQREAHRT